MSSDIPADRELPSDISRWPDDPAALLGVPPDATRRDLKRLYAKLIRRYKPEHSPEEFRRLREAYDHLDRELQWNEEYLLRQNPPPPDDSDDERDQTSTVTSPSDPSNASDSNQQPAPNSEAAQPAPPVAEVSDDRGDDSVVGLTSPDQLWQQALDGADLPLIYAGLMEQSRRKSATDIECARLYWMLTLKSDLDPDRDPCSFLLDGLRRHGFQSRLFPMLEIDVRRRGGQAPLLIEAGILDGNYSAHNLVNLIGVRWFVARRLERFDVLGNDFQQWRRRFLDEPDEWLRLLGAALRALLLTHADGHLQIVRQELDQLTAAPADNWIWDTLESYLRLHDAWLKAPELVVTLPLASQPLMQSVRNLVRDTWELSASEARSAVMQVCQTLLEAPERSLRDLARIESVARPLVRQLLELIRDQQTELNLDRGAELTPALDQELQRFTRTVMSRQEESPVEFAVLMFCLQETVTPYDLASTLSRMEGVPDSYFEIADRYVNSLSLNCIVQAGRLFW